MLGDAGLRVSDIHQHPLSVRVQAAVDHTRQPDGMLRPKVHRTPKLGRRPGSAALRGVYSGYYVWVNGTLAGYAEDSCLPSEFDVTGLLRPGENTLAVKVFKWTDGSYLEDADHWRMAGIHREVYLAAKPDVAIGDFGVRTRLDGDMRDALLQIRPTIDLREGTPAAGWHLRAQLYAPTGRPKAVKWDYRSKKSCRRLTRNATTSTSH